MQAPYIVLANHTTNYDPILLAIAFTQHMYFVASEHIYRWGLASKLINWAFAPIARLKGSTDARTVMEIIRTLRAGANVCIFAEGNRTYTGVTGPISGSTGKLVKASGAGLVTFRLEGGFFTSPRWGDSIRKGRMRGAIVRQYSAEELQRMPVEEVQASIARDLYEDAYARQAEEHIPFRGKRPAEFLETALYICPSCKEMGKLHSGDSTLLCTACGQSVRYTEYGMLEGEGLAFSTITQWDAWQEEELRQRIREGTAMLQDAGQQLFSIQPEKGSVLAAEGLCTMGAGEFTCGAYRIPLEEISDMAIVGRMTLVFSTIQGEHYELRTALPRSATKYLAFYHTISGTR